MCMTKKTKKIPKSMLAFPIIFGLLIVINITIALFQIVGNVKFIDYYILFIAFISLIGLFCVSISCMKELKKQKMLMIYIKRSIKYNIDNKSY